MKETLAKTADPDEIPQNAFHQGPHCLRKTKAVSEKKKKNVMKIKSVPHISLHIHLGNCIKV